MRLLVLVLITLAAGWSAEPAAANRNPAKSAAVRKWMNSLTLSQKVAQLVVIPFYGEAPHTGSRQYRKFMQTV